MTRHACRRDLPEPMVFSDVSEWTDEIAAIDAELNRVMDKFGDQSLNLFDWQSILTEEIGEVAKAINELHFEWPADISGTQHSVGLECIRDECIQVAAVAVHMAAVIREASCK